MKILESKFVQGFIKMADDGYKQGWHERNGGNLSYRLKAEEVEMIRPRLNAPGEWTPIGVEVPGLAGEFFLVTGSGKYFRNIIVDPEVCLAIIELDETGTNYRIRWGLVEGGRPTSELPTHLMNHEVKKKLTNGRHRVIYHAHTTNTIALTFVLPLDDKVFTRELWESATECPVVFPDGVGVIGWMVPGGRDIAVKTAELMKKYDVVDYQCKPYEGEKQKLITYITTDVETVYQKLKEEFPLYHSVKGGPFNIDIFPKGYSKLTGIHTLMQHWKQPRNDFMAFGDSYSDICTIQAAKIGVAMYHALDPVKAVADYICQEDRPDAIAQTIHHFGLL